MSASEMERLGTPWRCSLCGVSGPRTLEAMNDHLLDCKHRPVPDTESASLRERLREAEKERDDARAAIDGITEAADKITVANMDVAVQLRAAEARLRALSGSSAPQTAATPKEKELEGALRAIVTRCTEGDPRTDWLPIIANIARAALSMKSEGSDPDSSQKGEP